jgi:hypothetical protein
MTDLNTLNILLTLILSAAVCGIGWRLFFHRYTNLITTLTKFFAIIFIAGLLVLPLAYVKNHSSDTSISKDFVRVLGNGAILSTFRWPKGINLTDDEKKSIGRRVREARSRAPKGQPFDLTPSFIVEQFLKQYGLCYFTKKPMTWNAKYFKKESIDLNTVSISRLDPFGPYTKKNVVLCCLIVANMRNSYRYETTLKYSNAVVNHPLSLSDTRLLRRDNECRHLISQPKSIESDSVIIEKQIDVSGPYKNGSSPDLG